MDEIDYTTEEWRSVVGYENIYSVSSLGRVRRDKSYRSTVAGYILEAQTLRGYHRVILCNKGATHPFVHKLVAEAFIGPRPQGMTVNHIDGNKDNNKASNLEYLSSGDNTRHAVKLGLKPRGVKHGNAIFTESDISYIRAVYKFRDKQTGISALAQKFGVVRQTISMIVNRQSY